jgi:hypothetical protein
MHLGIQNKYMSIIGGGGGEGGEWRRSRGLERGVDVFSSTN